MPVRSNLRPLQSPASRIRSRADVVDVDGVLALSGRRETPTEARIADLLFLADAMDAADIEYLLIRDDAHRPILAVDEVERLAVTRALVAACADEPFLSVALKRNLAPRDESVLIADGDVAPARVDRLLALYRPRVDDAGVLHADPTEGVRFEFWVRQGAEVRVPAPERADPPPLHHRRDAARHHRALRPHLVDDPRHVHGPRVRRDVPDRHGLLLGRRHGQGVAARPRAPHGLLRRR